MGPALGPAPMSLQLCMPSPLPAPKDPLGPKKRGGPAVSPWLAHLRQFSQASWGKRNRIAWNCQRQSPWNCWPPPSAIATDIPGLQLLLLRSSNRFHLLGLPMVEWNMVPPTNLAALPGGVWPGESIKGFRYLQALKKKRKGCWTASSCSSANAAIGGCLKKQFCFSLCWRDNIIRPVLSLRGQAKIPLYKKQISGNISH